VNEDVHEDATSIARPSANGASNSVPTVRTQKTARHRERPAEFPVTSTFQCVRASLASDTGCERRLDHDTAFVLDIFTSKRHHLQRAKDFPDRLHTDLNS
jgi:hypothetical protein